MKYLLHISLALCVALPGAAQESAFLQQYRSMALEYSHDLKSAQRNIEASIELEKSAKADLKPKLSAGATFQYVGKPLELSKTLPMLENPIEIQGKHLNYGATASILQPVYTGGRILETIKMAESKRSLAGNQSDLVRLSICYQTDIQYWNTVARKEIEGITEEFYHSLSTFANTINKRVEIGLTDQQDLLMAQVKQNEAEFQFLQAKADFETGLMALNSLIGIPLESETTVDSLIPAVTADGLNAVLNSNNRPELEIAQDKINIEQVTKRINDSKYKPQLYIGVDGSYSAPGYDFKSDLDPNYALYAKLSVPIFEWGKRKNERRAANLKIEMATDQLNQVSDQVNLEVESSRVSLQQAIKRVDLAGSSLDKAYENEKKAMERYHEGKVSVIEVIDAQVYRLTSQVNYVQAKVAAQSYLSQLKKATNSYGAL